MCLPDKSTAPAHGGPAVSSNATARVELSTKTISTKGPFEHTLQVSTVLGSDKVQHCVSTEGKFSALGNSVSVKETTCIEPGKAPERSLEVCVDEHREAHLPGAKATGSAVGCVEVNNNGARVTAKGTGALEARGVNITVEGALSADRSGATIQGSMEHCFGTTVQQCTKQSMEIKVFDTHPAAPAVRQPENVPDHGPTMPPLGFNDPGATHGWGTHGALFVDMPLPHGGAEHVFAHC